MKIYHFETTEEDVALLKSAVAQGPAVLQNAEYMAEKLDLASAQQYQDAEIISVFVNSVVNKEVIESLPNLKLIVTRSTGFDHIDTHFAKTKNILVSNIPAYGSRTVAEFTFALILGLSRKTFDAHLALKTGHPFSYEGFEGFNLQDKVLGVIGAGKIGREVIQIAHGFNMAVLAFDAFPNPAAAESLGFTYAELDDVLNSSDVITLHVPYNLKTHHLINKQNILKCKKGALLINTSRGEVIDTESILLGLEKDILAGVGLDVLEDEHELKDEMQLVEKPASMHQQKIKVLLEDHMLMRDLRVVITPHMAFYTKEAKQEIAIITLQNILSFLGGKPMNIV